MSKKIFTALMVGCGGISEQWLKALKNFPEIRLIGLCDIIEANALKRKEEFELHEAAAASNYKDMLRKLKPDIVFDCTVPDSHAETVITAFKHGADVLGEKPMAPSMREAHRMIAASEKYGRTYTVVQNRRFHEHLFRFRNALQSGAAGRLHTLNADFYLGPHFGGFREAMDHVLILDMAIHTFDAARFISGCDPVSVYCQEWNPAGSWYKHGASVTAIFEMSDGLIFNYRGSWCAEGKNTSWESEWRAQCEKGSLLWDGKENLHGEIAKADGSFISPQSEWKISAADIPYSSHAGIINEFLKAYKSGKAAMTDCRDNIKSLAMVHAAIKSASTGRKIKISY